MRRLLVPITILALSLSLGSGVTSARATALVVGHDREDCPRAEFSTIQEAVLAASPGDRIQVCEGTYHEQVTITTNDLTIVAKGDSDDVVVDAHGHDFGFLISDASGVSIVGFRVQNAHDVDIMLRRATHSTVRKNVLTSAGHDGIELMNSDDNLIERNVSIDNLAPNACGINIVGGSERNIVRHNLLVNNEWGIQIAGGALDTVVSHNKAVRNRGNGIRNFGGASGTIIEDNRVFENGLKPGPLTGDTAAGIRIGGTSGTGVVVTDNRAFENRDVDLRSEVATATFEGNRCDTSSPPGLCKGAEKDD